MAKIIIFVGIDGTGKTSLIELFGKENPEALTVKLVENPHLLRPGESLIHALAEMDKWVNPEYEDSILVYDRFPVPDEYIYGNGSDYSLADLALWDRTMANFSLVYVYTRPYDVQEYLAHKYSNPDEHIPTHMPIVTANILGKYSEWLDLTACGVIQFEHHQDPNKWFGRAQLDELNEWLQHVSA